MMLVDGFLDLLRTALFALSHLYSGNLGAAILTLPIVLRLALLPLNARYAVTQRRRGEAFGRLKPQIERLQRRYEKQPERLAVEMQTLMRQHDMRPIDVRGCVTPLVQWPLWAGLYWVVQQASRAGGAFLWIVDISRPDRFLAMVAAGLTYLGISIASSSTQPSLTILAVAVAVFTLIFVSRAAAGVGLYWVGSAAVSVVQGMLVRRLHARGA